MTGLWISLSIGLPWLGALGVWRLGNGHPRSMRVVAVGAAVAGALASLGLVFFGINPAAIQLLPTALWGEVSFTADGLGVLLSAVAAVIGSLTVVFSLDYMAGEHNQARYFALVLLFIGAMVGLVLSASLLLLFIFWEITALCSYALISFHNDDPRAVAAGIKALIITQLGGLGLLAGTLAIYAHTGGYSISDFMAQAHTFPPGLLAVVGFAFLLAAMAKSAQVPFHSWLPDAMEAPTPVSALIHAATMVNAGVYLLARFYPAFAAVPGWSTAVVTVGVVSALLAGIMALVADDLKRVLAYSTISQLGYMVYAVGTGAVFASQFHLLSHAVFKALLFLAAGAVIHTAGTRRLADLGGLGRVMPAVRNAFVVGALALAGIPILNGFWSKELLLENGLERGPLWAYCAMLVGGGLTALYTFRVTWLVFFGARPARPGVGEAPAIMRVVLGVLVALTLTTWLAAGPLSQTLADTLRFHQVEPLSTIRLVTVLFSAPSTYLALVISGIGIALWVWRQRLEAVTRWLQPVQRMALAGFGFEWLNRQIARLIQKAAARLSRTQTGQLNWNMVGLVAALVFILLLLVGKSL